MSITSVRPYFRTRMNALNFKEWNDGFNFENIPSTILDGSYHIESGVIAPGPINQRTSNFDYPVIIRLFRKGFNNVGAAIDAIDQDLQNILDEVLSEANRIGTVIKNVEPSSIVRSELDASNDNAIILEVTFTAKLILCFP